MPGSYTLVGGADDGACVGPSHEYKVEAAGAGEGGDEGVAVIAL